MASKPKTNKTPNQYHEFLSAAQALECDESEERFNAALGQIVRTKPAEPSTKKPKVSKDNGSATR